MQPPAPPHLRYGLSIAFVAAALALSLAFQSLIPHGFILFFLCAVMLAGWFGGTRPGLLAVVVSTSTVAYYFIPPYRALAVNLDEMPYFLSFLLSALLTSWLGSTRRDVEARQQAHLDELFEQNPEAILFVDLDHRVFRVNKEFTQMFGYTLSETRGRSSIGLIVPPGFMGEAVEQRKQLEKGEQVSLETIRSRRDGTLLNVSLVSFPVIANGECIGYYAIYRDITKSTRALERLQKAQSEVAHLSRITTMGELASSIAHEINQPIGAMATNANAAVRWLTQQPPDLKAAEESLDSIVRDANRAARVIERIRSLLRKDPTPMAYLDLNEVIHEVLALTGFETGRRGAVISTDLAGSLPPIVGDRVQLHQVLLNLIMNSLDAMDGLTDRARRLIITSREEPDSVVVQVRDSGRGWNSEDADRIFNPFFTTKRNGIGMGLTISRSIIENHGGRLWAEGGAPDGAAMNFALPIAVQKEKRAQ